MKTEDHATTPPLFLVVSDDKSDDDSISVPQVSEGEPHSGYITPAIPIPPEPPPQKSSEEDPEGGNLEESPEGATPGCPIW